MKQAYIGLFLLAAISARANLSEDECRSRLDAIGRSFEVALGRTTAEYGDLVKSIHVGDAPPVPGYTSRIEVRLVSTSGQSPVVGWMNYEVQDGRLIMDVNVAKNDRGVGLNRLMLLAALKKHPEIHEVSGYLTETNANAYLVNLALSPSGADAKSLTDRASKDGRYRQEVFELLIQEIARLKSGERAKKFRERMIDAYASGTPAGRTEQAAGFKTIRSIVLTPLSAEDCGVAISAVVGAAPQNSETNVSIELGKGQWLEISPQGEVKKTFIPKERPS